MKLIIITNDQQRAKIAVNAGVDSIMVDLEYIGKAQRQPGNISFISDHTVADVEKIAQCIGNSKLMVRVNPINENSSTEIEEVLKLGADQIMLPMFTHSSEVKHFLDLVNRRAETCLLFETPAALTRIETILDVGGIDTAHIGLNDLSRGFKLDFMFELMTSGLLEFAAKEFKNRGIPFGIGGVARMGFGRLPAELILSEHLRLGSSGVILSRDFQEIFNRDIGWEEMQQDFTQSIERLRMFITNKANINHSREELKKTITQIASEIRQARYNEA